MLEDAPQSGRPVEVKSNQNETIIENNQHSTVQEIANILKIPNHALKIICTSLVMLMVLIFGSHISEKNLVEHGEFLCSHFNNEDGRK